MAVTIHDIAAAVGVAPSTVSRVLNRTPGIVISPAVCAEVLAAAQRLGYRRNYHAHALHAGRAQAIGYGLVATPHDPYFDLMLQGVSSAVIRQGHSLVIIGEVDAGLFIDRCLSQLAEQRFDALVLPGVFDLAPHAAKLRTAPVVVVEYLFGTLPGHLHAVTLDPAPGVMAAVDHLVALGHRRLLWFGSSETAGPSAAGRHGAFLAAVARHRVTYRELHCIATPTAAGQTAMERLMGDASAQFSAYLASGGDATGVVCYSEVMAHGVYHAAAQHGLQIPRDLSVIGFDDFHAGFAFPPMTVVSHMLAAMGAVAGDAAIALAAASPKQRATIPRHTVVPAALVIRSSTAAPGAGAT